MIVCGRWFHGCPRWIWGRRYREGGGRRLGSGGGPGPSSRAGERNFSIFFDLKIFAMFYTLFLLFFIHHTSLKNTILYTVFFFHFQPSGHAGCRWRNRGRLLCPTNQGHESNPDVVQQLPAACWPHAGWLLRNCYESAFKKAWFQTLI